MTRALRSALVASLLLGCGASRPPAPERPSAIGELAVEHLGAMGQTYRLERARLLLDGEAIADHAGAGERFELYRGVVDGGPRRLSVELTYRGQGHGVFSYLAQYVFEARADFEVELAGVHHLRVVGFEGGEGALADRVQTALLDCGPDAFPEPGPRWFDGCEEIGRHRGSTARQR